MSDQATEQSPETFASASDALAELDRRDAEAEAAASAEETENPAEPVEQEPADEPEDDENESDDEDDEPAIDEPVAAVEFAGQKFDLPKGTPKAVAEQIAKVGSDMQADYTRKTQEVAQERQVIQQTRPQLAQMAQQLAAQQQAFAQMVRGQIGDPPDIGLLQQNPQEYMIRKEVHERNVQTFRTLLQNSQANGQQAQALNEQGSEEVMQRERQELFKHHPELADEGKRQAAWQRVVNVGKEYGIDAQQIGTTADHRVMRLLLAATELADLKVQQAKVKAKVQAAPPRALKPAATTQTRESKRDEINKFMKGDRSLRSAIHTLNRMSR